MAKQGTITAQSGSDNVLKNAVAAASPKVDTLAGTMRDAFGQSSETKKVAINLARREVTVAPAGANMESAFGGNGLVLQTTFTKDDGTKSSSPMTGTDEGGDDTAALIALDVPVKPSRSVEARVNEIEDFFAKPENAARSAVIVVDQEAQTIDVYSAPVNAVANTDVAANVAEEAHFKQTLTQSAGVQFGE